MDNMTGQFNYAKWKTVAKFDKIQIVSGIDIWWFGFCKKIRAESHRDMWYLTKVKVREKFILSE